MIRTLYLCNLDFHRFMLEKSFKKRYYNQEGHTKSINYIFYDFHNASSHYGNQVIQYCINVCTKCGPSFPDLMKILLNFAYKFLKRVHKNTYAFPILFLVVVTTEITGLPGAENI